MPTVSGDTLALPPSNSSQALAWIAGNTAFCAASPYCGANSAPRLTAYFFNASLLATFSVQIFSTVLITSSGTPLGTVSYTHLRAHETRHDLVCRLLLE